jgi:hypothetical protein
MAVGPGEYDNLCTYAREMAMAEGVVLIVVKGDNGSGFCVEGSLEMALDLPRLLRTMANEIEATLSRGGL